MKLLIAQGFRLASVLEITRHLRYSRASRASQRIIFGPEAPQMACLIAESPPDGSCRSFSASSFAGGEHVITTLHHLRDATFLGGFGSRELCPLHYPVAGDAYSHQLTQTMNAESRVPSQLHFRQSKTGRRMDDLKIVMSCQKQSAAQSVTVNPGNGRLRKAKNSRHTLASSSCDFSA